MAETAFAILMSDPGDVKKEQRSTSMTDMMNDATRKAKRNMKKVFRFRCPEAI